VQSLLRALRVNQWRAHMVGNAPAPQRYNTAPRIGALPTRPNLGGATAWAKLRGTVPS
jgi:hypothetical protein